MFREGRGGDVAFPQVCFIVWIWPQWLEVKTAILTTEVQLKIQHETEGCLCSDVQGREGRGCGLSTGVLYCLDLTAVTGGEDSYTDHRSSAKDTTWNNMRLKDAYVQMFREGRGCGFSISVLYCLDWPETLEVKTAILTTEVQLKIQHFNAEETGLCSTSGFNSFCTMVHCSVPSRRIGLTRWYTIAYQN